MSRGKVSTETLDERVTETAPLWQKRKSRLILFNLLTNNPKGATIKAQRVRE